MRLFAGVLGRSVSKMNHRIKYAIGLWIHMGGTDRGKYIKEYYIFKHMEDNVCLCPEKFRFNSI